MLSIVTIGNSNTGTGTRTVPVLVPIGSMDTDPLVWNIYIYRDPLDRLWSGIYIYIAIFGCTKGYNSLALHGTCTKYNHMYILDVSKCTYGYTCIRILQ